MELTPKEKAEELLKMHTNYFGLDTDEVNDSKALVSALVTVSEIIKYHKSLFDAGLRNVHMSLESPIKQYSDVLNPLEKYWNEVKEELELYWE